MKSKGKKQRNCSIKIVLTLLLGLLLVRSLPYLAPIRVSDLAQEAIAVEFSDRNGLPLGTILSRDREHTAVVPLKQVSPHFINAILAAEDAGFYHHGALDLKAIARSILQAIEAKRVLSGASTITMQLARMLEPAPRTLKAKMQEIWLSWRIEAGTNKDDILAAYINRLPMGGNIYGTEAASRVYFGIPAADLNLAQASLLAAIPNNPTYLNPYDYWEPLKKRQKYVLDRMVEEKYINSETRDRAYEELIALQTRRQGIIAAPHFLFWVAEQLPKDHPAQIQTSLDRPLQQFVEAQVKDIVRSLAPHNVHQGAAIVIDNHTGEILACVGSVDYFADTQLGRNDGVQALRQPGSTLKPFLYQLALEKRLIRPNTVLADVPIHYAIPGAKLYSPSDYTETFQGPVRIRIALANSLNVPAVRVLEKVGVAAFLERLHQLGFEHLKEDPEYYGLGLTLGSGEVSLWELARAYFQLAANSYQLTVFEVGAAPPLRYVRGGVRKSEVGSTDFPQSPVTNHHSPVPHPETWSLIADILRDRYARAKSFGVDSVLTLPFPAAVKTGTSSNYRDTWTVGFTTDYTVATWVGNFDGEPMQQISGVTGAALLWNRIMLHLHEKREPTPFPPVPQMVQRPICAISGLKPTAACPSVVREYFYPEDLAEYERQPDTFYQMISSQSRLNLPEEYDEWLSRQPQINLTSDTLKILSPSNGDSFLVAPNQTQRLEFKIGEVKQLVEWRLNGEKLATYSANSIFWQMRPGTWTLEVKSGEISDKVTFHVQVASQKSNRRGFSVARPQS
ncbi:penicillin-binding protein 1C [Candidatus Gracilibacteria bacterium]|nr:penicillin-binding protein 1C [Candidatus Gracilibacteria bacterium]